MSVYMHVHVQDGDPCYTKRTKEKKITTSVLPSSGRGGKSPFRFQCLSPPPVVFSCTCGPPDHVDRCSWRKQIATKSDGAERWCEANDCCTTAASEEILMVWRAGALYFFLLILFFWCIVFQSVMAKIFFMLWVYNQKLTRWKKWKEKIKNL